MLKNLNELKEQLIEIQEHINHVANTDINTDDKFKLIFNQYYGYKVFNIFKEMNINFEFSDYNGSRENDINIFVGNLNEKINYLKNLPQYVEQNESSTKDKIISLVEQLNQIHDSNLTAEDKYHLIFNKQGSKKASELLAELNLSLDYYDPDTTYEEDVAAYMDALNDKIKVVKKAFKKKI